MFFPSYKKTLTQVQLESGVTEAYLKADNYMFKHNYMISYLIGLCIYPTTGIIIAILSCISAISFLVLGYKLGINSFYILAILSGIIEYIPLLITKIVNKGIKNGESLEEIQTKLINKLQNIYLINPLVISFNDWKKLKKVSKTNYDYLRSVNSIGECYRATYYIANVLRKKQIKIMWLVNCDSTHKYGHAVLVKNNWIYDTNMRKTYSKRKYLELNQSKIFKKFYIDEYLAENIDQLISYEVNNDFVFRRLRPDWNEFKIFCENIGAKRSTAD